MTDATALPRLYFDNAATSHPKPPEVLAAMTRYATEIGARAHRAMRWASIWPNCGSLEGRPHE